jgi:endonuclease/exonuclease/phosphatase family metal-dependent hydrolase
MAKKRVAARVRPSALQVQVKPSVHPMPGTHWVRGLKCVVTRAGGTGTLSAMRTNAMGSWFFFVSLAVVLWPAKGDSAIRLSPSDELVFRVMCYNIQHGRGMDGRVDLARIAGVIREQKADIVALQEVDRGVERTDRRDLPSELAALTGMQSVFFKNHPHQGGEYGNAVLTRFPYRDATNLHLPMVGSNEQRGIMRLVLHIRGQEVLFMNTHLDHRADEAERLASVSEFARLLRENDEGPRLPILLAGDFNAVSGSLTYQRMSQLLVDTWPMAGEGPGATVPVREPTRRIDFIWISPEAPFAPVRAWVPFTEASDHLPVVVEFRGSQRAVQDRGENR